MKIVVCILTRVIFWISISIGYGQENQAEKTNTPHNKTQKSFLSIFKFTNSDTSALGKKEFFTIPVIYRSPETGFAFGGLGLALFKMPGVTDIHTRTSNVEIPIIYTQRHQFVIDILYNLISNKERFFLRGLNGYNQFSEFFYGIGNNTPNYYETKVNFNSIRTFQRLTYRFDKRNFIGLQYQFYDLWQVQFENNVHVQKENYLGNKGFHESGLGLVYLYDSRNNVINSHTGTYIDISNYFYLHELGSQYTMGNITLDVRKFISVSKYNTLGFQGIINANYGDVPFRLMANMGGFNMMRGYYTGRYRDKDMIAFQAEYRFRVWKFFGMVFFGSLGEVASKVENINVNNLKLGIGTGLRFMIEKHERVNIRIDFGFGQQKPGIYLNIGEAF